MPSICTTFAKHNTRIAIISTKKSSNISAKINNVFCAAPTRSQYSVDAMLVERGAETLLATGYGVAKPGNVASV